MFFKDSSVMLEFFYVQKRIMGQNQLISDL